MLKRRTAFIALAICLALIVDSSGQSQRPSPRSRESIQPPISKTANPAQSTASDQRGTEQSPVIVKVLPTDNENQKAAAEARREEQKSTNDENLAKSTENLFWATIALSVIATLQLFVFGWQGIQLKRTVDLANREFISTQRPKIVIRQIVIWQPSTFQKNALDSEFVPFVADEKFCGHLDLANIGGTKATIEFICNIFHWRESPLPMVPPYNALEIDRQDPLIILEAGKRFTLGGLYGQPPSAHVVYLINAGEMKLYAMGWVRYTDDRNVSRETRFCRSWNRFECRFSAINDPDYEYSE